MHRSVTDRLLQDHQNIGSVLTLMRFQLDILAKDDAQGLTLLGNATNYLIHYPGLLHHPVEEILFEGAAQTPAASQMHTRLRQEHSNLTTSATNLVARIGLQQLSGRSDVAGLHDMGLSYIMAYAGHIRFEEDEVFPLAQKP